MTVEIGDMVAADDRVGEVVGFDSVFGRAVIRPFPRPGNEQLPAGEIFTASTEARLLKKHYEWPCRANRANEQQRKRLAHVLARSARDHSECEAAIHRDWYDQHREPGRS